MSQNPQSAICNPQLGDQELMGRVQGGDARAFEVLYLRYAEMVVVQAGSICPNEAEDLAQEVWLKVWRNAAAFDCAQVFPRWLNRITRNTALDRRRKDARYGRLLDEIGTEVLHELLACRGTEAAIAKRDVVALLRSMIARACSPAQAAVLGGLLDGLAQGTIAARDGMPLNTVKHHALQGRAALKIALEGMGVGRVGALEEYRPAIPETGERKPEIFS